uniref:Mortality factor 4-like protein 2 n=1 Tax=Cercocebus atys TaxID=9531 RepID=A0A2K5L3M7_CERAT
MNSRKKQTRSNMQRSKMRGVSSGKKTAGSQGSLCREPPSGSMRKTRKNKQKTPGNRDGGSTSEAPQPPQKKRAREAFKNRMGVKVKIPEELKLWLIEDWDLVTRQKQLFQLPAKKNVDAILEEYANCKKSQANVDNKEYAVNEVVAGIKEYFFFSFFLSFFFLRRCLLLYKFERPQYPEILLAHPDAPMSQVYGAPHLLRLFVRTGAMLAYRKALHYCWAILITRWLLLSTTAKPCERLQTAHHFCPVSVNTFCS